MNNIKDYQEVIAIGVGDAGCENVVKDIEAVSGLLIKEKIIKFSLFTPVVVEITALVPICNLATWSKLRSE